MQRGTIGYLLYGAEGTRKAPQDDHAMNECPPGSLCAAAAIQRVQERLKQGDRHLLSRSWKARFVEKTGGVE